MLVLLFSKVVVFCSILTCTNVVVLLEEPSRAPDASASSVPLRWDGSAAASSHDGQCAVPDASAPAAATARSSGGI